MQAQKYKISAISLALSAIFSNLAFADDDHAHETITVLGKLIETQRLRPL